MFQNEDLTPHISKLNKTDLEESYKKHVPDISSKIKQDVRQASKNSRFKIVNLSRSVSKNESLKNSDTEKIVAVLDIETEDPKDKNDKSAESNFVYDLYYTNSDDLGDCFYEESAEKYFR